MSARDMAGAKPKSASVPSCRCSTVSTVCPASSSASASHWPVNFKAARRSRSHRPIGRAWLSDCRSALTGTASVCVCANADTTPARSGTAAAAVADGGCSSRHRRTPALRSSVSAAVTVDAGHAGAFLSQSRTASVEASQTAARSKLITPAAARVVDNFQPVSSRMRTPRWASMAPTRRVSERSCATSATGQRPAARCCSTQAAARSASSSASSASCNLGNVAMAGGSGASNWIDNAACPDCASKCACSARPSGSRWKPSTTTNRPGLAANRRSVG